MQARMLVGVETVKPGALNDNTDVNQS